MQDIITAIVLGLFISLALASLGMVYERRERRLNQQILDLNGQLSEKISELNSCKAQLSNVGDMVASWKSVANAKSGSGRVVERIEREAIRKYCETHDSPFLDGTRFGHPAWDRGFEEGHKMACLGIIGYLDHNEKYPDCPAVDPYFEKIRRGILALREKVV